jgi:methylglyoxal synthase
MAAVWNIPHACNTTTADYLISSSFFDQELSVEIPADHPRHPSRLDFAGQT